MAPAMTDVRMIAAELVGRGRILRRLQRLRRPRSRPPVVKLTISTLTESPRARRCPPRRSRACGSRWRSRPPASLFTATETVCRLMAPAGMVRCSVTLLTALFLRRRLRVERARCRRCRPARRCCPVRARPRPSRRCPVYVSLLVVSLSGGASVGVVKDSSVRCADSLAQVGGDHDGGVAGADDLVEHRLHRGADARLVVGGLLVRAARPRRVPTADSTVRCSRRRRRPSAACPSIAARVRCTIDCTWSASSVTPFSVSTNTDAVGSLLLRDEHGVLGDGEPERTRSPRRRSRRSSWPARPRARACR